MKQSLLNMARSWRSLGRGELASARGHREVELVDVGLAEIKLRDHCQILGNPIVFAADGPNVIEHYDDLLVRLGAKRRALVLDMPGFGFSNAKRCFDFTRASYVEVVRRLLRKRDVHNATLVFPCAWGFVALELACVTSVRRLILPQTPSWADMQQWANRVDKLNVLRRPLLGQTYMALRTKQVAQSWYDHVRTDATVQGEFARKGRLALERGGCFHLASMMQGFLRGPLPARSLHGPATTVLWGLADRSHRHSRPEGMLELAPGCEIRTLAGVGHFPELEAPAHLLQQLIRDFPQ